MDCLCILEINSLLVFTFSIIFSHSVRPRDRRGSKTDMSGVMKVQQEEGIAKVE